MARLIVVSYDIPRKDFGVRVQYSVFECRLEPDDLDELRRRINKLIEPAEDSVRLYRFCQECDEKQEIYGQGKPTEEPEVYIL